MAINRVRNNINNEERILFIVLVCSILFKKANIFISPYFFLLTIDADMGFPII